MIPANKKPWLDWMVYSGFRRMMRGSFHRVWIRGLEHVPKLTDDRPVIAFCNHTNWWDAVLTVFLTRTIPQKKFYCMMEEKQLKTQRFFTWMGAFGVDPDDKANAGASLKYALKLLKDPETLMWIFPQGRLVSVYEPVRFQPGTGFMIRAAAHARILPVAYRYEFLRESRPEVLVTIGEPQDGGKQWTDEALEALANETAASLTEAATTRDLSGFQSVLEGSLPINKKWEWVQLAVQGRLSEFNPDN